MQTRSKYIEQLEELESCVRRLGEKTVADVRAAGLALAGDAGAAEGVFQGREAEKRLQSAIESSCFDAMLLQQPLVAGDLRFVSGVFRIVSDLTHIGAMTRDVAYLATVVPGEEMGDLASLFLQASERVAGMVDHAVGAFLAEDEAAAREVYALDDAVDELYDRAKGLIVDKIRATDTDAAFFPEMLMVAKYFERMGDDAQRIASWAVFRVTGNHAVYSAKEGGDASEAEGF